MKKLMNSSDANSCGVSISVDFSLMGSFSSIVHEAAKAMNSKRESLEKKLYSNHSYLMLDNDSDWDDYSDSCSIPTIYDNVGDYELCDDGIYRKNKKSKSSHAKSSYKNFKTIRFYEDLEHPYDYEFFDSVSKLLKYCSRKGITVSKQDRSYLKNNSIIYCTVYPYDLKYVKKLALYCTGTYYSLTQAFSYKSSNSINNFE